MTFSPLSQICRFYASSVGKKYTVALTAIVLLGFLPVHVIGNLLIFGGPDALNEYAHFLHTFGHGMGVWAFRLVLLSAFLIHIIATIQLARQNRAARSEPYAIKTPQRSTFASRTMIISGLIILSFVIFHILHYTVRISPEFQNLPKVSLPGVVDPVYDVYSMVIMGFQNIPATVFYVIGVSLLCMHLSHGVSSVFQTLGLRSNKTAGLITVLGKAYAVFIWIGFLVVPLAVAFQFVK